MEPYDKLSQWFGLVYVLVKYWIVKIRYLHTCPYGFLSVFLYKWRCNKNYLTWTFDWFTNSCQLTYLFRTIYVCYFILFRDVYWYVLYLLKVSITLLLRSVPSYIWHNTVFMFLFIWLVTKVSVPSLFSYYGSSCIFPPKTHDFSNNELNQHERNTFK